MDDFSNGKDRYLENINKKIITIKEIMQIKR